MAPFAERQRGGYRLSARREDISLETMYQFLSTQAYWAVGRTREAVETSVENSHLYGVLDAAGATVAFCRVVTDQATFAWLCDVFVDPAHRGEGLGTWMVGEVVDHWVARGVSRMLLGTRDAHEVYARVGFTPLAHPERMMNIDRREPF